MRLLYRGNPLAFPGGTPGFDPTHIAALGCRFSGIAGQGAGGFTNLLTGAGQSSVGGSPTPVIDGLIGPAMVYASSSDLSIVPMAGTYPTATQGTMAAIIRVPNVGTSPMWTFNSDGGANGIGVTSSPAVEYIIGDGATVPGLATPAIGTPIFYAVSWINASTLNVVLTNLATGQITSQATTTTRTNATADTGMIIGNRFSGGARQGGTIAAVMTTNVFMTLQGMLVWAQRPWDFWYPPGVQDKLFSGLIGAPPVVVYTPPVNIFM